MFYSPWVRGGADYLRSGDRRTTIFSRRGGCRHILMPPGGSAFSEATPIGPASCLFGNTDSIDGCRSSPRLLPTAVRADETASYGGPSTLGPRHRFRGVHLETHVGPRCFPGCRYENDASQQGIIAGLSDSHSVIVCRLAGTPPSMPPSRSLREWRWRRRMQRSKRVDNVVPIKRHQGCKRASAWQTPQSSA